MLDFAPLDADDVERVVQGEEAVAVSNEVVDELHAGDGEVTRQLVAVDNPVLVVGEAQAVSPAAP